MALELEAELDGGLKFLSHSQHRVSLPAAAEVVKSPATTDISASAPSSSSRVVTKHVHFTPTCTTDIIAALFEQSNFRYSLTSSNRNQYCRPILKHNSVMSGYLRKAGNTFARALSALGAWCTAVTSENPNVRSDMYKQIVAQIRGSSPHLKQAGEAVLCENVHGMWMQLIEDFSMQREEFMPRDNVL